MKKTGLVVVVSLFAASMALADKPADKAGEKKEMAAPPAGGGAAATMVAPKPPAPPKMEAPKPAAENDALKPFAQTWNCDGKGKNPDGSDATYKTSIKGKWDVDKFWLSFTYDAKKSKTHPLRFLGQGYMGWSATDKKYVMVGFDNMGGWIYLWSTGWDASGNTMVFTGDMMTPMGKAAGKFTFTKDGDKNLAFKVEATMNGQAMTFTEDTCKR
jgi:hypothetical protein